MRPLTRADVEAVHRIHRESFAIGRPLPEGILPVMAGYERVALDWYLGPGAAGTGVVGDPADVQAYVLVCTDRRSLDRWQRRAAAGFLVTAGTRFLTPSTHPDARRFIRLRVRDTIVARRARPPGLPSVEAHLNVAAGRRNRLLVVDLLRHVDSICRSAGAGAWMGEMNAPIGRRAPVIGRYGFEIVARTPNLTLSWLAGRPVERLTVIRRVDRPLRRVDDPEACDFA